MRGVVSPEAIHPRHVGERIDGIAVLVKVAFVLRMPVLVLREPLDCRDHRSRVGARLDERTAHVVEGREVRCRGDAGIEGIGERDVFSQRLFAQVDELLGRAIGKDESRHLGVPFPDAHEVAVDRATDGGGGKRGGDDGECCLLTCGCGVLRLVARARGGRRMRGVRRVGP